MDDLHVWVHLKRTEEGFMLSTSMRTRQTLCQGWY